MPKIYTRTGDAGQTGLTDGSRMFKDDVRIDAYGTIDELNAVLGVARAQIGERTHSLEPLLAKIQHELFVVGSRLATPPGPMEAHIVPIQPNAIAFLEKAIDVLSDEVPPLTRFILPAGCVLAAQLHHARTVCRRAERVIVALSHREPVDGPLLKYVNRLSDFLFVAARWANKREDVAEVFWES